MKTYRTRMFNHMNNIIYILVAILIAFANQKTILDNPYSLTRVNLEVSATTQISYQFDTDDPITSGDCLVIEMINPYSSYLEASDPEMYEISTNYKPFASATCTFDAGVLLTDDGCPIPEKTDWSVTIPLTPTGTVTRISGKISGFINPFSISTDFTIQVSYKEGSCSTLTTTQRDFPWMDTLTTGAIPQMDLTVPSPAHDVVGKLDTPLTVKFRAGTILPLKGILILKFPAHYTHASSLYTMVKQTFTLPTSGLSGITSFTERLYTPGPTEGTMTLKYQVSGTSGIYGLPNTQVFEFVIQGFNNPISQMPLSGFTIQISDFFGNAIDQTETYFTFQQSLRPAIFLNSAVILQNSQGVETKEIAIKGCKIRLQFELDFPVETMCFFVIKFPREVMIDIDETVISYSGDGYGKNLGLISKTPYSYGANLATQQVNQIVLQGCSDYTQWVSVSRLGKITISRVVSPGQIKDTDEFSIQMYKDSALTYQIATSSFGTGIVNTGMQIRNLVNTRNFVLSYLLPITDTTIEASTDFGVEFIITKNVYADSIIEIELPDGVMVGSAGTCSLYFMSSNINSNAYCSYTNGTVGGARSLITIYNAFVQTSKEFWAIDIYSNPSTLGKIEFKINSIINPISTKEAGSWTVRTKNFLTTPISYTAPVTPSYIVDQKTSSDSYTPTRGTLSSTATGLTTNSQMNFNKGTSYTFAIRFSNDISPNGYLKFQFPSDFLIDTSACQYSDPSTTAFTVTPSLSTCPTSVTSGSTTYSRTSQILYTQIPLGMTVLKNTDYFIMIKGITNPRSFKPSESIEVTSMTNDLYDINYGKVFSFTTTVQDTTSFSKLTMAPKNTTNGAINDYTLTINSKQIPFKSKDFLYIQMPSQTSLPAQVTCSVVQGFGSIQCSNAGQNLIIQLDSISGTGYQDLSFIIKNIRNPPSFRPSFPIPSAYVTDSEGYSIMRFSNSTPAKVTTTSAANILAYSLYQDNLGLDAFATYRIEFLPTNKIGEDGAIVITWPQQVKIDTNTKVLVTTNQKRSPGVTINTSARTIKITNSFTLISGGYSGLIQIEISPVKNPRDNRVLNGFQITTFDDSALKLNIDTLGDNLLKPKTECNFPCKTCLGGDMNYCLSCWSDGQNQFLQSKNGGLQTCQGSCDQSRGFTINGDRTNKICVKCDPSCKTCIDNQNVGDKFKCRECSDTSRYFYPASLRCMGQCENGFYESSKFTCSACQQPCYKCNTTATTCTDCFKESRVPLLYSKTCISSCPTGFTGVDQVCLRCKAPCDTCFNSTSQCLSCSQQGLQKFLFAFQCFETCPVNTTADTTKMICKGCMTGCKRCDQANQTKCFECNSPFILFDNTCMTDCPGGYKRNAAGTECEMASIKDLNLVYFPFAIGCFLLAILAIGGYFKDRKSLILSNMIVLFAPVELLAACVQLFLSLVYSSVVVTAVTGLSVLSYIIINCVFMRQFNKMIAQQDADYQFWMSYHEKTYKFISYVSRLFSFKMIRLNYSFLYGFDIFKARFSNPQALRALIRNYSILHFLLSSLPLIAIDLIIFLQNGGVLYLGLPSMSAIPTDTGKPRILTDAESSPDLIATIKETVKDVTKSFGIDSQIKIVMIETLLIGILMGILTVWELCKFDRYMALDYNELDQESNSFLSQGEDKADKQMRREMLKKIMQQVKGTNDLINDNPHNQLRDLNHAFGKRRCKSMTSFDNDQEEDPREVRSEPPQAMPDWDEDPSKKEVEYTDNVYAESQPSDPLGKLGKQYTDMDSQVTPDDFAKIISRKGDFVLLDGPDTGNLSYRRKRGPTKHRGRKNQYYNQIDAEDDQEAEHMESEMLGDIGGGGGQMGVIREVIEEEAPAKASSGKKKQVKISEEQEQLDRQMRKIELERAQRDREEQARKLREEQEAKRLEEEMMMQTQRMIEKQHTFGRETKDPRVQVPPEANKRTFNENDILGDFDRDEKGNIILLQDQNGNYIDKQGRRVNERGYLVNPDGDIIENQQQQTMFEKKEIDDRGEIPAPFCVEKHNFSPFKVRGEFNLDKNKLPIITKNRNGDLVDKYGRMVNRKGWLVDKKGNIVDFMGVKKFDQRNLNPDNGDLPRLFNFNGQRYDIMDICGAFDLNPHNGEIVLKTNAQGQNFDKFGRLVNQRGYLIDQHGHIVDKDGRRIFDKRYLSSNGEVPKIFPFTKFNIQNIQGDFEMDPVGNPILERKPDGSFVDREGKRVNQRGYYCDEHGNIVDKKGKIMFNKEILDQDGEIPEVFRSGLLKSDSASSLSRLMSEIERNQPEELYNNQLRGNKRSSRIYPGQGSGGDTSVESMMDDTPSNYNRFNQRNNNGAQQYYDTRSVIDEQDELRRGTRRKHKKKKKKGPVQEYTDPSEKDIQMAKAYGGVAKPQTKRVLPKGMKSPRSSISHNKGTLNKIAGSVSGMQRQHPIRRELEETKDHRQDNNQSYVILNDTNDPSMMAVPEHHLREEKLKKQKLKELRLKGKLRKKRGSPGDPDFEKMFGKDIDEFLEDSDWDIESFENMSQYSRGTAKSAFLDGRIRGLESIYLQRLESQMKKGTVSKSKKQQASKPKFRVMQDRFIDDPTLMVDNADNMSSNISQNRKSRAQNNSSAMHPAAANMRNMSVTAQTQFRPPQRGQF